MRPQNDGDLILAGDLSPYYRRGLLAHHARWVALLGITEQGGENRGTAVEFFQKATDGKARGEPWCAEFVAAMIQYVDGAAALVFQDSRPSALFLHAHVQTMWERSSDACRKPVGSNLPQPGDLMVWAHYRGGERTPAGHVGIVIDYPGDGIVKTVEGNTSAGEGVVREGDGVYERLRNLDGEGSMRTLGWLRVWL